jgi:hypothetical protein
LASKRKTTESAVIPELLAESEEFVSAWAMWLDHLKQKRKPASPYAQYLQLRKCIGMGVSRSVAMLNHSIEHNWLGLYEENENKNTSGRSTERPKSIKPDHSKGW